MGTFSKLKAALRQKKSAVKIDTAVFKLHYRVTFILLVTCSILVTSRQYIGEHINCIQDSRAIPNRVLNTYCFISATFTVPRLSQASSSAADMPHLGLGSYSDDEDVTYHAYYQWVPFVLFAQALMFYTPYYLWKMWEDNKVRSIVQGMHLFNLHEAAHDRATKEDVLAAYILRNLHDHNAWAVRFFLCEAMNLVNVVAQIFLTDKFLGGEFLSYGVDVVDFLDQDPETRIDPMARVFPRITKCIFHTFGPSGTIQKHDAMCVLALNIINEKIYTFIWFWFIILAVITGVDFLTRVAQVFMPSLRTSLLRMRLSKAHKDDADLLTQCCSIGDWLLLDFLGKNLDTTGFSIVVGKIGTAYGHLRRNVEATPMLPVHL